MRAEILFAAECPNLDAARLQVERLLAEHGVNVSVDVVEIPDQEAAERLGFVGSPTIRIDGKDVAAPVSAVTPALGCRTYFTEGRVSGIPADGLVRAAIAGAVRRSGTP